MPSQVPGSGTKGNQSVVKMALRAAGDTTVPTAGSATVSTAGVTAGATSIGLTSGGFGAGVALYTGQWIEITDTDSNTYVARVNADYTDGTVTTLTVNNCLEAIPAGATIEFPVPMRLRTSADLDSSTNIETFATFDHRGSSSASPGETTNTFTTNGFFSFYDPGYQTLEYAQRNSRNVYIERQLEAPGSAFTAGLKHSFIAIVSSLSTANPTEGSVSADMSFQITGDITTTQPTTA